MCRDVPETHIVPRIPITHFHLSGLSLLLYLKRAFCLFFLERAEEGNGCDGKADGVGFSFHLADRACPLTTVGNFLQRSDGFLVIRGCNAYGGLLVEGVLIRVAVARYTSLPGCCAGSLSALDPGIEGRHFGSRSMCGGIQDVDTPGFEAAERRFDMLVHKAVCGRC
jgi:hypothetical protein